MSAARPFDDAAVEAAFAATADDLRAPLLRLRELIFETAEEAEGCGRVVETLKWGQPSYLTVAPKSGSTLRIGAAGAGRYALFVHCQTTLIENFRALFPDALSYEGARAVLLDAGRPPPEDALRACIALALTYHARKRRL